MKTTKPTDCPVCDRAKENLPNGHTLKITYCSSCGGNTEDKGVISEAYSKVPEESKERVKETIKALDDKVMRSMTTEEHEDMQEFLKLNMKSKPTRKRR